MSTTPKRPATTSIEVNRELPIDLTSRNTDLKAFPHPFYEGNYGEGREPKSLIELNMMRLSGLIRSKLNWYEKLQNEIIRNKWKDESLEQGFLSEKQIDYVLSELEYYHLIKDESLEMSVVDGVWQSDELISLDIKQSLMTCMKIFEDIQEEKKDWHPETNKQILDLVHPSLFCFVNQISRMINENHVDDALEHMGEGEIIDINDQSFSSPNKSPKISSDYTKSTKYQWLPSEMNISKDGQVQIDSYINNLHPIEHQTMYRLIEQIFARFIPLFNKVLTDLIDQQNKPNRIKVDPYKWYDHSNPSNEDNEDEDDDDDDEDDRDTKPILLPDVGVFEMPSSTVSTIDLCGRRLQVIVKLADIILTPNNSKYPGGVWHVEGMENEHIVATGIYYYHNSNLTQSDLQFRTTICEPNYEQDDHRGVQTVYGLTNEGPLNQSLGEVITQEDRCIAFPNIYQHRVAPFQLKDSTQSGQRKILVFFLVDPSLRIISTAHVPPQQSHWYTNLIRSISPFNRLPLIVVEKILSYIDFPMSLNQAKEHRGKLMEERKYFISQNNQLLFERPFSLCEH